MTEDKRAEIDDRDHARNMRNFNVALKKMQASGKNKRDACPADGSAKLSFNPGAFIRKVTANGADKTMSTYWTYKGSLTTPGTLYINIYTRFLCRKDEFCCKFNYNYFCFRLQ